ncbi:MAG TPA: BadF/BadG/BcrA/BcrD ATPase family protein [Bryobacteraceae bacterium]|nr:BadF/BadG/BcrA/BcrD ATPase family protein [Bryobacteraceae bacterium]
MRLYLGIDGGQSSTTALIANETGRIIGRGRGGPCNHVAAAEGRAKFLSAVGECLEEACREAGLERNSIEFAAACLGFSGGAEDKALYTRELIRSRLYKITDDAEIALAGATAGQPGIIVIAGTGSIAYGRNAQDETARAGGWGYIFGDEGGAFDLAKQALRAALRQEEGWGPKTLLHSLLLEKSGAKTANELLHAFYGDFDRTRIATLAPLVTQAAEQQDQPALEIIERAAVKLSWFADGVYHRLFRESEQVRIAYIGGVFQSPLLREQFIHHIKKATGCTAVAPRLSPAAGALLQALRLDGNPSELSEHREPQH